MNRSGNPIILICLPICAVFYVAIVVGAAIFRLVDDLCTGGFNHGEFEAYEHN